MSDKFDASTLPEPTGSDEPAASRPAESDQPAASGRTRRSVPLRWFGLARIWFRAFRRTRPFWGGLWSILGGLWVIRWMNTTFFLAVTGGWSYSAGYVLGGGMALFGLLAWIRPDFRTISGLIVVLLSLFAFINANLGGFLVGTVLGIIGGSMIWAWGEKSPRRSKRGTS